ncbi:MAG: Phosphopantetheine attachment site [Micromonosporaceae bacterium]
MSAPEVIAEQEMRALLDTVIWQVVGFGVAADATFFETGLSSATLLQVHARIQDRLGRPVPLWAPFKYPTPRSLARYLVRAPAGAPTPTPIELRRAALGPAARRDLRARIRDRGR